MHAIPEKLSALRQSLEASMIRQNVETRQDLEKKVRDSCKDAEDRALKRAEELLVPQMHAMSQRLQGVIQAVQERAEEAFPKIGEVTDQLGALRAEVQPLHQRADAAAARIDRMAIETQTASKDCSDLNINFKVAITNLREQLEQETSKREAEGGSLKAAIREASRSANTDFQTAQTRLDAEVKELLAKITSLEERLQNRVSETADHSLRQQKIGDEEVISRLRPEIQAMNAAIQKRAEDSQEYSEVIVKNAVSTLRQEVDASAKRTINDLDRRLDRRARDINGKMSDGFEAASQRSDAVKSEANNALIEATTVIRKAVSETRAALSTEAQTLRSLIQSLEVRAVQAADEAERKAVDLSARRLEDAVSYIHKEMMEAKQLALDSDEGIRSNLRGLLEEATSKLDKTIEEKATATFTAGSRSVEQAFTQLQSELADAIKAANARSDEVRCHSADALNREVQARMEALQAIEAARDALNEKFLEEARSMHNDAVATCSRQADKTDRRLDAAISDMKCLERSLQAANKEFSDTSIFLRSQLKVERERSEELGAQASQFTQQVRDSLEARLGNEATDLREGLADARKKIYDEATALRAEWREQPTKRELAELATTTTEQYNELSTSIDYQRSRLEAAMAEFPIRVREARSEASDVRARMQRETMTLGAELTTLRSATSSLANGVLKALHVIGFVRGEEMDASAFTGSEHIKEQHLKSIEIEDLLEWEKVGKSLATRISRQWYLKESAGIPTILSLVERKAEAEELGFLRNALRACSPTESNFNDTTSTMVPSTPKSPKSASGSRPESVMKVREQRYGAPQ